MTIQHATPSTTPATTPATPAFPTFTRAQVRQALLAGAEIALIDVREEDPFAQAHPLWAANFPLSKLELEAWPRIPRRDTLIVVYGEHAGEDLAPRAASVLQALGYTNVHRLEGGLAAWIAEGGEVFRDVNVPSKSFGEVVEAQRHTPSLSAEQVQALIDSKADAVIVDARRFDEYQTMSIPTATSVPGAELVLRVRELAPDPRTQVIVNCAGRTRSIIGTQSLVNAGIPNPVAALRNGTIGWTLAGQRLDRGASRRAPAAVGADNRDSARRGAREIADRAGVRRIALAALPSLQEPGRTVYRFDVRTPEEFADGHLPGFVNVPGGQLVQETDHNAPVRGARIVLADDDDVRAGMTASWLAQMGWDVWVVEPADAAARSEAGAVAASVPVPPAVPTVAPAELAAWLDKDAHGGTVVLDFTASANYVKRHLPGAYFVIRAQLADALVRIPPARRYVLTCGSSLLARFAAADLQRLTDAEVAVLEGGTQAWIAAGLPLESGETHLASERTDRYRRPYEGTDNPREAMQGYLDWEFGLIAQLERDGTHGFRVA
ncbi:rhodanese-related sulfurtransferase [Cupriavidus oxalaticus]|uniref:Sulfurtransferase n=2 Tax=Cupriavidus oxalaticus TaxID=96344 RepID=A0A976BJA3_9BURK|nr:rhodanese-related sulfurtransferase [Cupriavidus oxalaticus]QRQ85168.1 rhodanese-related sulfurtransferase [Cupriavidus oxalaticus]QRQ90744.1 rhodanese-related sulfurtransferase [Cupriavidus oxalaticus]WQD85271.1 rhodanese-related sulfurtransferase [Cupriavidus oxalaticus]SPC23381.1 Sulfurtransferase [Cupriavidus oxalaticus]